MPVPNNTAPCNVQNTATVKGWGGERVSDEGDTIAIAPLKIKIETMLQHEEEASAFSLLMTVNGLFAIDCITRAVR